MSNRDVAEVRFRTAHSCRHTGWQLSLEPCTKCPSLDLIAPNKAATISEFPCTDINTFTGWRREG